MFIISKILIFSYFMAITFVIIAVIDVIIVIIIVVIIICNKLMRLKVGVKSVHSTSKNIFLFLFLLFLLFLFFYTYFF